MLIIFFWGAVEPIKTDGRLISRPGKYWSGFGIIIVYNRGVNILSVYFMMSIKRLYMDVRFRYRGRKINNPDTEVSISRQTIAVVKLSDAVIGSGDEIYALL